MKVSNSLFIIILFFFVFVQVNYCLAWEDTTMQASAILGAAIGLYDIITAPSSAKDYNQQPSTFGLKFSRDLLVSYPNRSANISFGKPVRKGKSPALALLISLVSTGIPTWVGILGLDKGENESVSLALVTIGATIGPSTGHFYAKKFRRGLFTAGLRLILWGMFLKGVKDIEFS